MRPLLIVDLEATCWERPEHDPQRMETIEIGAVLADPQRGEALREYQGFVRPVRAPQLSDFCRRLTTIRQADVEAAPPFPEALARFVAWIGDPAGVRLASWGYYDKRQLLQDCAFHAVPFPFDEEHVNLKRMCSATLHLKPAGLAQALAKAGLELRGTHHRGLDDARNMWRLVQRLGVARGNGDVP